MSPLKERFSHTIYLGFLTGNLYWPDYFYGWFHHDPCLNIMDKHFNPSISIYSAAISNCSRFPIKFPSERPIKQGITEKLLSNPSDAPCHVHMSISIRLRQTHASSQIMFRCVKCGFSFHPSLLDGHILWCFEHCSLPPLLFFISYL